MKDLNKKEIKEINAANHAYKEAEGVSLALDAASHEVIAAAAREVIANAISDVDTFQKAYAIAKAITDDARNAADEAAIDYEVARLDAIHKE